MMTNLKKRDILIMLVLTFVTCGIYGIYWYFVAISELNDEMNRIFPQEKTINPVIAFLLGMITCGIYPVYAAYIWTQQVKQLGDYYQVQTTEPILTFLLWLCWGVGTFLIQNDMNKMVTKIETYQQQQFYQQQQQQQQF